MASKIDSSEYADLNRVIGWFIVLRWIACAGVAATLLAVRLRLVFDLPFPVLYALTGLLCLLNVAFTIYFRAVKKGDLSRRETASFFHVQITSDYALLFFLVYFTGFLDNPFSYFFVFHVMLTAFIFSSDVVFVYVGALVVVFAGVFLAEFRGLIPHYVLLAAGAPSGSAATLRETLPRLFGLVSTLALSAYLITSIKRRIAEKGERVEVELDRYKTLDKVKSNFILQVTHELRGPLAAMSGYHEMILRGIGGEVTSRTREIVRKADHRTDNLLTIIDEMIDYAYMKSGEDLRQAKIDLALREIIDENLGLLEAQAERKQISLVSNCPRELTVRATRDSLKIILGNLVNNAIKYSPPRTTVAVNAQRERGEVHLAVRDEGYGIEPEELEKIFDEFYRTRRARELERDGTGLGLPIVKRAVEALSGRLTVYSELDKGTTFHIFLPATEATDEQDPDHR